MHDVAAPDRHHTPRSQGGSPWGVSTLAGPDGSRKPTESELDFARHQVGHPPVM